MITPASTKDYSLKAVLNRSMASGRNKSDPFSEMFMTFHKSSDQVCFRNLEKMDTGHLQGSTEQQS